MEKFLFDTSLLSLTTFDGFSISSGKTPGKAQSVPPRECERVTWDRGVAAFSPPKFPLGGLWLVSVAPF